MLEYITGASRNLRDACTESVRFRARALRQAVEDGWFKYFLLGTGVVGAALTYDGIANNNEFEAGVGEGIILMSVLYAIVCYGGKKP